MGVVVSIAGVDGGGKGVDGVGPRGVGEGVAGGRGKRSVGRRGGRGWVDTGTGGDWEEVVGGEDVLSGRATQRAEKTTESSRRGVDCQDRPQNVAPLPPDAVWPHDVIGLPRFFPRTSHGLPRARSPSRSSSPPPPSPSPAPAAPCLPRRPPPPATGPRPRHVSRRSIRTPPPLQACSPAACPFSANIAAAPTGYVRMSPSSERSYQDCAHPGFPIAQ